MRDHFLSSDSFRLFSLLCRLCQSSISWYSSGPAQKFVLRQIKAMDAGVMSGKGGRLDAGPLMLYGHILFTSTSYVYAIRMCSPFIPVYPYFPHTLPPITT